MSTNTRREFLSKSVLLAGSMTLTGRPARAVAPKETLPTGNESAPTRRFLDAIEEGDLIEVTALLDRDAGLLHTRDVVGRSAFAVALVHGYTEIATLLRDRGFAPDLHESALALDWERFDELAAAAPGLVNRNYPIGGTAMFAAATGGAGSRMWKVYRFGGDPDARPGGKKTWTPLRAALEFADLETAEMSAAAMLSNGANPHLPQPAGSSPLHVAAARGSADIVELLLRKGADPTATDDAGRTPGDLAGANGYSGIVELLRRKFPQQDYSSRTAYDVNGEAYRAPDLSAFATIVREDLVGSSHGKLDHVRDRVTAHPMLAHSVAMTTERAVEAGAHMGRKDIVDYLLEQGAPYSLPTAVMRGDLKRVRALLDENPRRIHERGAHDFALLWFTVIGGSGIEAAEMLIERGADVEDQHFMGTTALHYAALGGQKEMVTFLIENGADVNRVGRKFGGQRATPLQLAEAREQNGVARLLRDRGATG